MQEIDSATKKEEFLSRVTSAMDEVCQCGFFHEIFRNVDSTAAFQCFENSPTTVTFRGEIGAALRANTSQVISYMEQWVATNPTIVVQNTRLRIDSSCNVKIDSFIDPECGNMTSTMNDCYCSNMTSTVNDGSNTAAITVGGVENRPHLVNGMCNIHCHDGKHNWGGAYSTGEHIKVNKPKVLPAVPSTLVTSLILKGN